MSRKYKRSKRGTFAYDGGRKRDLVKVGPLGGIRIESSGQKSERSGRSVGRLNPNAVAVAQISIVHPVGRGGHGALVGGTKKGRNKIIAQAASRSGARVRGGPKSTRYVSDLERTGLLGGASSSRSGARRIGRGKHPRGAGYIIDRAPIR